MLIWCQRDITWPIWHEKEAPLIYDISFQSANSENPIDRILRFKIIYLYMETLNIMPHRPADRQWAQTD